MFLERLPAEVQTILASGSQDHTVSQLAEMADRMIEVQRFRSLSVAQISTSSSTANEQLVKQVSAMADEMTSLKLQLARLGSSCSRSRRRSPETGKPVSQRIDETVFSGSSGSGRTFYVCDTANRRRFLVDSGAQISVVPTIAAAHRFPNPGLHLQAASCAPIPIFVTLSLTLNFGLRRSFTWVFVIADVPHALLGSDFLAEFDLLVDCRRARLLDRTTRLSVRGLTSFTAPTSLSLLDTATGSPFRRLLLTHPNIINPQFRSGEVQHDVDFAGALFCKAVCSKIDLVRAFHQIPVAPEDIPKTACTTPSSLSEFIRMPFDLRNAAQTLQMFINHVFHGLPFVYAHINDLMVASRNEEEHKEHLALVFDRPDKFGVVIKPSNCVFGVPSLEFLGHPVDSEGLRPLTSKVEAVRNFPPPTSKRQLQRFLGMVSFYRRFLSNCADLMLPLTNMLSGPKGPLELTGETLTAFERINNSLADVTLLTHLAPKLSSDTRYSTFGRELLAIYLAVKHFRHFLEGRDFTVFTDHKPLTFPLRSRSVTYNSREIAHVDYISQSTINIRYIDGTKNEVTDMLSRPSLSSLQLSHGVDFCALAAEQQRVGCLDDESVSALQLKDVPLTTGSGNILCDISTPFHHSFVPASTRRAVFQTLNGLSHPGIRSSQKLLAERFIWPGMNKDVKAWTRSCLSCQRNKVQRHNKSPPGTFPSPDARFSHVHLDVIGPLHPSNGFTHLLTCFDRYTRWAEAILLPNTQAETIVKAFVSRWVAVFGAPSTVTTDCGAQFELALFQTLLNVLVYTRIRMTAYHPAANGMVERFHHQLNPALRAVEDPGNWSDNLPLALLGIRAVLKSDVDCSAAEMVFSTILRLPGKMITSTSRGADETPENLVHRLHQFMRSLFPVPPRTPMTESYVEKDFEFCTHVFVHCDRVW
nr:unnamed protein product [Spirometra erinaceieuropaei]